MKSIIALAAIGMATFGFVDSASAFKFSPAPQKFTGVGTTTATLAGTVLPCNAKLTGLTLRTGKGKVAAGHFSGATGCTTVTFANTPWPMTATSATTATITGVDFFIGAFGFHCTGNMNVTVSGGVISWSGVNTLPPCTNVGGSLTTTPSISIVP